MCARRASGRGGAIGPRDLANPGLKSVVVMASVVHWSVVNLSVPGSKALDVQQVECVSCGLPMMFKDSWGALSHLAAVVDCHQSV